MKIKVDLRGDEDCVFNENKIINALEHEWGWLVDQMTGEVTEVDSNIRMDFRNGDYITEEYKFRPFGTEPEHIEAVVDGKTYTINTDDYSELLENFGSHFLALIHFYFRLALRISNF